MLIFILSKTGGNAVSRYAHRSVFMALALETLTRIYI